MSRVIELNSVEGTKLWRALSQRRDEGCDVLVSNLASICEVAIDRIKAVHTYAPQYTLHDDRHFLRVTELMSYVLGEELINLNSVELALLILSSFFHDQGMVPLEREIVEIEKSSEFRLFRDNWLLEHPNYKETVSQITSTHLSAAQKESHSLRLAELDSVMLTEYLRSSHGRRSEKFVVSFFRDDERLDVQGVNIAGILGKLCLSHTLSCGDITPSNGYPYDEQIGRYCVNLPYLACILRLADILDFDRDRTPEVLLKNIHFTSEVSLHEWEKHRSVEGWSIAEDRIRFTVKCTHPAYESSVLEYMNWIDWELEACHSVCRNQPLDVRAYNLKLPSKVDRTRIGPQNNAYRANNLEFSLSRNEIVRLLMTDNLYGNNSLCIRELLQNSLDALRYRRALFQEAAIPWENGIVEFRHYVNSDGFEVLECKDNGAGMDEDIIQNHFVRVGRSFYRSPFFDQERNRLKQSGSDFDPCSKFGIGFMSCFMLGDRITIRTRKDYGQGRAWGPPLIVEIHGLSGLLVVRKGDVDQPIGTTVDIVCRQKPSFLDQWTDKVKLCTVLRGYALATEFPIKANCEVNEILEEVKISPELAHMKSLMESVALTRYVSFKQDLSVISPNLRGYVRESFLVDENGVPCLGNNEAEWCGKGEGSQKKWILRLLSEGRSIDNARRPWGVTICCDGILIAGSPGRYFDSEEMEMRLGTINSGIYSRFPSLVDARGVVKPEITPARTPPSGRGGFDLPPGWRRVKGMFEQGCGQIGAELAGFLSKGLGCELFWKLCVVHDVSVKWIPRQVLWDCLPVSLVSDEQDVEWALARDVGRLSIRKEGSSSFVLCDSIGRRIGPSDSLSEWELSGVEHASLKLKMNTVALLMCALDVRDGEVVLTPRSPNRENEFIGRFVQHISFGSTTCHVEYWGEASDAIAVETPYPTVNRCHALSAIALESEYVSQLNDLQEFACSFISCIAEIVSTQTDRLCLREPGYWQKRIGHLFFDVQWDRYEERLQPPYRIWTRENGWINFGVDDFARWRNSTVPLG